jgi:hypothetical protein
MRKREKEEYFPYTFAEKKEKAFKETEGGRRREK